MDVLSIPFRFQGLTGRFKKTEYNSEEYKAQQITAFVKTHLGERPIYQDFGIEDPTFDDFDEGTFGSEFASFYDNIELMDIVVIEKAGAVDQVDITFE
jgi:hypothetical protein